MKISNTSFNSISIFIFVFSDGFLFGWGTGNLGTGEDGANANSPMRLWDLDGHRISSIHFTLFLIKVYG